MVKSASPGVHKVTLPKGVAVLLPAFGRSSAVCMPLALGCVLAGAALSAFAPVILSALIDDVVAGTPSVPLLAAGYAACLGLARAVGEGRTFFHGQAEQDILRVLTRNAARHILSLPMSFFGSHPSGALVQILENGLQGYRLLLQHAVLTLLPGLVEICVIAFVLYWAMDGAFLAVFAVTAFLYGAAFRQGARNVLAAGRRVSAARIEATSQIADSLRNIEIVKAFSVEPESAARLDEALLETRQAWRGFHTVRLRNGLLVTVIFLSGFLTVLTLAAGRITAGEMSAGDFVLVSAYMLQITRPIELLGYAARDLGQGAAFIERLAEVLQVTPEMPDEPAAAPSSAAGMSVCLSGVTVVSDAGEVLLRNVSLEIGPGDKIGLVGASGSGKSTLLRLLLGFCVPQEGEIRIDGSRQAARREETAFIPQTPGLLNATVERNVALGADCEGESVRSALRRVGLEEARGRTAGEGGLLLSGGERQRIAVARALMRRPRLVLADEPTSALDPETESRVLSEINAAFSGATLILASHRVSAVQNMDRIVVMSQGQVFETGTHETLLAAGGLYARMWETAQAPRQDTGKSRP